MQQNVFAQSRTASSVCTNKVVNTQGACLRQTQRRVHVVRVCKSKPSSRRLVTCTAGEHVAVRAMSFQERTGTLDQVAQIPLVQLPAQAAQAFKDQFEALQHEVDWMQDSTLFEKKAREVLDNTCSPDLRQQLSAFTTSSNAPSALLLSGLPVEDHLPPTIGDPPIAKDSQLTEALMFSLGSLWGHAFGYEGMQDRGCVRDLIASDSKMYSSTTELQMHRDFGIAAEHVVPHLRLILCMRPDKARQVETLVCDNRQLLQRLSDKEIHLLRTVPITFLGPNSQAMGGAKPTITGSDSDPIVNLFDVGVFGDDSGVKADDPAAAEAYQRASEIAKNIAQGVKLDQGQMLVINNNRATHARTESPIEPDGYGRWLKVTHVRSDIDPTNRYMSMG